MAPEERRWVKGFRQGPRSSDVPLSVQPPTVHRNAAMKRPTSEVNRRSENCVAPTPLAATTELQAYLWNDIDAKSRIPSRIPRPRPVKASVGKKEVKFTIPPEARRLSSTRFQPPEIKLEENERLTHFQAIPTSHQDGAIRTESPLSRFQKQAKQARVTPFQNDFRYTCTLTNISRKMYSPHHHSSRERDIPKGKTLLGPSLTLTQSLMHKIQEARRLRQTKSLNGHQLNQRWKSGAQDRVCERPSNCNFLDDSQTDKANIVMNVTTSPPPELVSLPKRSPAPPIPHAKPVMPAIPPLSTEKNTEHEQGKEVSKKLAHDSALMKAIPSNDINTAMKAVRVIQRIWRQKRCCRRRYDSAPEQNQATLVVDRYSGNEHIIPLFSSARLKCQGLIEQQQMRDVSRSATECAEEICSAISDDEARNKSLQCPGDKKTYRPSYDPWTDHELVFLEEGRCIGELQESVRKGVVMDQEELVWKRPQHVIQQIEAQRVAMVRESRKRRALCRKAEYGSSPIARVVPLEFITSSAGNTSSPVQMSSPERLKQKIINASKRKLLRISFKHKSDSRKMVASTERRLPTRRLFIRVQRTKESRRGKANFVSRGEERARPEVLQEELDVDQTEAPPDSSKSNSQPASSTITSIIEIDEDSLYQNDPTATEAILDRFVIFADSGKTSTESDTRLPRNDLISAMSLLYEEHGQDKDELA